MSLNEVFSRKVRRAREKKGYTQSQVAEMVSVSVRWYQEIERGGNMPSAKVLLHLLILLAIDPMEFEKEAGINDQVPLSSR